MRPLTELISATDSALPLVRKWAAEAVRPVEFLAPSPTRDDALLQTQVTTRSPMGAIVYETGGLLIDHGWLRVLGSGYERLTRTLPGWNAGRCEGGGFLLVADDAVGGFFAINGGGLGPDVRNLYYFSPDTLEWEPLEIGYSAFLQFAFAKELDAFYDWIRWPGWEADTAKLHGDRCFSFYPFLFTREGRGGRGQRSDVPVDQMWGLQMDIRAQLGRT
jgi:uncharacterized protein DUF2625